MVSELIDENLIKESGPGESSGGRRPIMLLFNALAGYTISIDLGIGTILGVLTDLNGNSIYEERINFNRTDFEAVFPKLLDFINHLTILPRLVHTVLLESASAYLG